MTRWIWRFGWWVMHLSPATARRLSYAEGFLALGLAAEAAEELAGVSPVEADATPVLRLRLGVETARAAWSAAAELAQRLCEREPRNAGHWIQLAYATRRGVSLEAAREILWRGLTLHPREATIHFNLACYEAQLGHLDIARAYLAGAVRLEPGFAELAKTDPDLAPLR